MQTETPKVEDVVIPLSILFIMDNSGSMENMGVEPLNGLNKLVEQQKAAGDFRFTLVAFDDEIKTVIDDLDGKEIPTLTSEHYSPRGMTALLDAIGYSILAQKEKKLENVLVVILTDGLENASWRYTSSQIKKLITEMQEKHNWAFMYLGANQDSFLVSQSLGITLSQDYECTGRGCHDLFRALSDEISRCVTGENPTSDFRPKLSGSGDVARGSPVRESDNFDDFEILSPPILRRS